MFNITLHITVRFYVLRFMQIIIARARIDSDLSNPGDLWVYPTRPYYVDHMYSRFYNSK